MKRLYNCRNTLGNVIRAVRNPEKHCLSQALLMTCIFFLLDLLLLAKPISDCTYVLVYIIYIVYTLGVHIYFYKRFHI